MIANDEGEVEGGFSSRKAAEESLDAQRCKIGNDQMCDPDGLFVAPAEEYDEHGDYISSSDED